MQRSSNVNHRLPPTRVGHQTWYGPLRAAFSYVEHVFSLVLVRTLLGSEKLINARNAVSSPRTHTAWDEPVKQSLPYHSYLSVHRINAIDITSLVVSTFLTGVSLPLLPHGCHLQDEVPFA